MERLSRSTSPFSVTHRLAGRLGSAPQDNDRGATWRENSNQGPDRHKGDLGMMRRETPRGAMWREGHHPRGEKRQRQRDSDGEEPEIDEEDSKVMATDCLKTVNLLPSLSLFFSSFSLHYNPQWSQLQLPRDPTLILMNTAQTK